MRGIILLVLFLAVSLVVCHAAQKRMKMHNNEKAMKQEIAKQISIGSTIEDARRIMEANGFKCELMERASFADKDHDGRIVSRRNLDFLWCDKEKGTWFFCDRRWQVVIVHERGIVNEIVVAISQTCM